MNTTSPSSISLVATTDSASGISEQETFTRLCRDLGRRINGFENALICVRAYRAYVKLHPDTAHGKGNKSDRAQEVASFRKAAAEASGVSSATIDALLQVGKAFEPLSEDLKEALRTSSLGMRMLRKLAPKKFNDIREARIKTFLEEEKTDAEMARANLEAALESGAKEETAGKRTSKVNTKANDTKSKSLAPTAANTETEADDIIETTYELVTGGHVEMRVGDHLVRLQVNVGTDGRIQVTTMTLLGSKEEMDRLLMKRAEASTPVPAPSEVEKKAA